MSPHNTERLDGTCEQVHLQCVTANDPDLAIAPHAEYYNPCESQGLGPSATNKVIISGAVFAIAVCHFLYPIQVAPRGEGEHFIFCRFLGLQLYYALCNIIRLCIWYLTFVRYKLKVSHRRR